MTRLRISVTSWGNSCTGTSWALRHTPVSLLTSWNIPVIRVLKDSSSLLNDFLLEMHALQSNERTIHKNITCKRSTSRDEVARCGDFCSTALCSVQISSRILSLILMWIWHTSFGVMLTVGGSWFSLQLADTTTNVSLHGNAFTHVRHICTVNHTQNSRH